jgi:hypothetical protein
MIATSAAQWMLFGWFLGYLGRRLPKIKIHLNSIKIEV